MFLVCMTTMHRSHGAESARAPGFQQFWVLQPCSTGDHGAYAVEGYERCDFWNHGAEALSGFGQRVR